MPYFAVVREAGADWADGGIAAQQGVAEHAAFMTTLADEGFVISAGPLGGSEDGRLRALVIVDADGEHEIHERFATDPWVLTNQLVTVSIASWNVFVGAERLSSSRTEL